MTDQVPERNATGQAGSATPDAGGPARGSRTTGTPRWVWVFGVIAVVVVVLVIVMSLAGHGPGRHDG